MTHNLTNEQQQLITMYVNQYNQTNNHIDQLLDMLDVTRNNIMTVLSRGQSRRTRNNHSRNSDTNINQFNNQVLDGDIQYNYNNPIPAAISIILFFNPATVSNSNFSRGSPP